MTRDLSSRAEAALCLLIAEVFLKNSKISEEDRLLAKNGIEIGWAWVEGKMVDSETICNYIDGDICLPYRSTLYVENTAERNAMIASYLSIGIAANYSCNEANAPPSESVDNFGDDEFDCLMDMTDLLNPEDQARVAQVGWYLIDQTASEAGQFGRPLARSDLTSA
ncbi:Imm6 family immunity protein [Burkholderia sp. DN3021]|uniref:Imm6 family immunity protein n=1 Tax=Burkholderia sp. DN3021 TaxID=3410137 RepID=UPI003C7E8800